MKNRFFSMIFMALFFVCTSNVFSKEISLARCYDAVLDVENYSKQLYDYEGIEYEENVSVDSYSNITVEQALYGYDLYVQSGDKKAMCVLGEFYYRDVYLRDIDKACSYFKMACDLDYGPAYNGYANCLSYINQKENEEQIKQLYLKACDKGYVTAFYNISNFEEYYARTGDPEGLFMLGIQYSNDDLIKEAAKKDCLQAVEYLSKKDVFYAKKYQQLWVKERLKAISHTKERLRILEKNADAGAAYEALRVYNYYYSTDVDVEKMIKYLTIAADGKISYACSLAFRMYSDDFFIPKDYEKAWKYLQNADLSFLNKTYAKNLLFTRLCVKDYLNWYKQNYPSEYLIDFNQVYDEKNLSYIDKNKALEILKKLADKGDKECRVVYAYLSKDKNYGWTSDKNFVNRSENEYLSEYKNNYLAEQKKLKEHEIKAKQMEEKYSKQNAQDYYELAKFYLNENLSYYDQKKSYEYYIKAAEKGNKDAYYMAYLALSQNYCGQKDNEKAFDFLKKGVKEKDFNCIAKYAESLESGRYNAQNIDEAIKYYKILYNTDSTYKYLAEEKLMFYGINCE